MMSYKYDNEPEVYKKLLELNKKQDELSKIKAELKGFTENVKNLEILKNSGIKIDNIKKND
jgi:hypothetical protein